MTTPKALTDLRYETVFETKPGQDPMIIARKWFKDAGFEFEGDPSLRLLFKEDGKRIYESYIDSGSDDYIYIIAR